MQCTKRQECEKTGVETYHSNHHAGKGGKLIFYQLNKYSSNLDHWLLKYVQYIIDVKKNQIFKKSLKI